MARPAEQAAQLQTPETELPCPEGAACRLSDSSFAKLADSNDGMPIGYIAKPKTLNPPCLRARARPERESRWFVT